MMVPDVFLTNAVKPLWRNAHIAVLPRAPTPATGNPAEVTSAGLYRQFELITRLVQSRTLHQVRRIQCATSFVFGAVTGTIVSSVNPQNSYYRCGGDIRTLIPPPIPCFILYRSIVFLYNFVKQIGTAVTSRYVLGGN
jgi:hypothetical protein